MPRPCAVRIYTKLPSVPEPRSEIVSLMTTATGVGKDLLAMGEIVQSNKTLTQTLHPMQGGICHGTPAAAEPQPGWRRVCRSALERANAGISSPGPTAQRGPSGPCDCQGDRKSTRLNSSHT